MKTLRVGDVFHLKTGDAVYTSIPERFVYSNKRQSMALVETDVVIGDTLTVRGRSSKLPRNYHVNLEGEYVVERAELEGGGTGMGPHDVYPDGWHVTARRLRVGRYDKKGAVVSFYQSGCFTVVHPSIRVIRTMERVFQ